MHFFWSTETTVVATTSFASAETLASGLVGGGATQIVSSGTVAFWVGPLELEACPFGDGCGGTPVEVADEVIGASLALYDGQLYFVNGAAVVKCPAATTSCNPTTIGQTFDPLGVATDGTDVYWLDSDSSFVYRCPVTGCGLEPEQFAVTAQVQFNANIVLDGEYVYWTDSQSVLRKHK
jgi:hypothetical protein